MTFQLPISWSLVVVCWACDGPAATVTAMMVASSIFFMPPSLVACESILVVPRIADRPELFREAFGDEQGRAGRCPVVQQSPPNRTLIKLIPRTVQRALINLAIEDAIAGEESSCKKCFPSTTSSLSRSKAFSK